MLVVDDDNDLRRVCASALEDEGYEVTQAASAREAITSVERSRPDLVLTDVSMPGMNGLELCEYLVKGDPPRTSHVLVTSAFASAEPAARTKGARAFLLKPFTLDELLSTLHAVLEVLAAVCSSARGSHAATSTTTTAIGNRTRPIEIILPTTPRYEVPSAIGHDERRQAE